MPYFIFKCRKCRNLLFSTDNIVRSRGVRFQGLDPNFALGRETADFDHTVAGRLLGPQATAEWCQRRIKEEDPCDDSLWFLDLDSSPDWVLAALEQNSFLRGKLTCPRCEGRVGGFDFHNILRCQCRHHIIPSIRVSKSRVDLCTATLAAGSTEQSIRRVPQNRRFVQNERSVVEDSSHPHDSDSLSSFESGYESGRPVSKGASMETSAVANPAQSGDQQDEGAERLEVDVNQFASLTAEKEETVDPVSWDENHFDEDEFPGYKSMLEDPDVEALTCSVCLELYYHPHKCEPCKHVYCGPCLRRLRASTPFNTKCPLCREIIWKCLPDDNLDSTVQTTFPQEYRARKKVEKKLRNKLPPLPGCASGPLRFFQTSVQRYRNRRASMLTMWSGACFVLLLMIFGFTVFATTVGFFLWYLLEVAMDIFIDVFMEMNNFFDRAWQALIILCIEGQVPEQVNTMLAGSVRRMFASFGKLANRTKTFLNDGEIYEYGEVGVNMRDHVANMRDHVANETSQLLSRMAQASVANYLLVAALMTYMVYRLARYMQRLPA
ncbi:hypothetical protein CAPTEDRAFT_223896 [Capitella teleta]|uniref:RING-type domain-containing protein n=1 Tax=Capitella teleta TaxID=283909 RepID=R7UKI3_CAPTE|nr:hypothetical protein CAPTEDRAFT_223896 [Capitella teleta]|eukprot:ELU04313.1 hypothetical protein CAPTEDRAFT_223896 [Capitella teleta]